MKFSDVVLAVATDAVIWVFVYTLFGMALIPSALGSYLGNISAGCISVLVAGLVVGFVFAGKIQEESRIRAVGKITVLHAVVGVFFVLMSFSINSYSGAILKEGLESMLSTGAWTTTDWFAYVQLAIFMNVAINVALTLVVSFIGLYAGSMLKKPKKT